jgi:hypothetical protein
MLMTVILPGGLNERNGRQCPRIQIGVEVNLIPMTMQPRFVELGFWGLNGGLVSLLVFGPPT